MILSFLLTHFIPCGTVGFHDSISFTEPILSLDSLIGYDSISFNDSLAAAEAVTYYDSILHPGAMQVIVSLNVDELLFVLVRSHGPVLSAHMTRYTSMVLCILLTR